MRINTHTRPQIDNLPIVKFHLDMPIGADTVVYADGPVHLAQAAGGKVHDYKIGALVCGDDDVAARVAKSGDYVS